MEPKYGYGKKVAAVKVRRGGKAFLRHQEVGRAKDPKPGDNPAYDIPDEVDEYKRNAKEERIKSSYTDQYGHKAMKETVGNKTTTYWPNGEVKSIKERKVSKSTTDNKKAIQNLINDNHAIMTQMNNIAGRDWQTYNDLAKQLSANRAKLGKLRGIK